jgi:hypothetical protein
MSGAHIKENMQRKNKNIEKMESVLFPASSNKKVSIAQLDKVFGKELFGEKSQARKSSKKKKGISRDGSSNKPKRAITFSEKLPLTPKTDRMRELKKLGIKILKDVCKTRYRIDCQGIKKKDDIISIIIRREY